MRIIHPRPELGAQSDLGVDFIDGVATVESLHPERELALLQHGYIIEADPEIEAPFQADLGEPIIDLNTLTKAELRGLFPEGTDLPGKLTKSELVDLAAALPAAPIPGDTDNGDGSFTNAGIAHFAEAEPGPEMYIPLPQTPAPESTDTSGFSDEF